MTDGKEKKEQVTSEEDSDEKHEMDVYNQYLHSVGGKYENEHDLYSRAREDLARVHKDKMAKVRVLASPSLSLFQLIDFKHSLLIFLCFVFCYLMQSSLKYCNASDN